MPLATILQTLDSDEADIFRFFTQLSSEEIAHIKSGEYPSVIG